jgi:hypothetical protein
VVVVEMKGVVEMIRIRAEEKGERQGARGAIHPAIISSAITALVLHLLTPRCCSTHARRHSMADELDPRDPDEETGRTNEEDITGSADDEEFDDIDDEDDEQDEEDEETIE